MGKLLSLFASVLLAASFAGSTVPACAADEPPVAAEAAADPYEALHWALFEQTSKAQMQADMLELVIKGLQDEVPGLAELAKQQPAVLDDLRNALNPVITEQSEQAKKLIRPREIAILRETMTPAEARSVNAFYRSDLGRKLLDASVRSFKGETVINAAFENPEATLAASDFKQDASSASKKTLEALSPAERKAIEQAMRSTPGMAKMRIAMPKLDAVQLEMATTPLTPEELAQTTEALRSALEPYYKATN